MIYQEDHIYIDQVLSGNTRAYATLVDKHKDMVFTVALNVLRNTEDAEEVAQDAFVKAFHALKDFHGKSKFSTWIYRIVYNAAISRTRKKEMPKATIAIEDLANFSEEENLEEVMGLDEKERNNLLNQLLDQLSPEERLLITLYYYESKSVNEIAETIQLSASNVKVKLFRIRNKMHVSMHRILRKTEQKTLV